MFASMVVHCSPDGISGRCVGPCASSTRACGSGVPPALGHHLQHAHVSTGAATTFPHLHYSEDNIRNPGRVIQHDVLTERRGPLSAGAGVRHLFLYQAPALTLQQRRPFCPEQCTATVQIIPANTIISVFCQQPRAPRGPRRARTDAPGPEPRPRRPDRERQSRRTRPVPLRA
jgi:hypothetical protein